MLLHQAAFIVFGILSVVLAVLEELLDPYLAARIIGYESAVEHGVAVVGRVYGNHRSAGPEAIVFGIIVVERVVVLHNPVVVCAIPLHHSIGVGVIIVNASVGDLVLGKAQNAGKHHRREKKQPLHNLFLLNNRFRL